MDVLGVKRLTDTCTQANVIDRDAIYFPPETIADIVNLTVEVVKREEIEALLVITEDFMNLPNSDEATLIAIGISEELMRIDPHLVRWFLDALMRDAPLEMRAEMATAWNYQFEEKLPSAVASWR